MDLTGELLRTLIPLLGSLELLLQSFREDLPWGLVAVGGWRGLVALLLFLALLAFLAIGWWLQRGRARVEEKLALLPDARPAPMPLVRAAALAFAVTLPLAFLFAARSSVVIFPALTLVFWRGWSVLRTLGACALTGIVVGLALAV